jgi:two-component system cell cycle sensor histidine kinase/response regulator CckA
VNRGGVICMSPFVLRSGPDLPILRMAQPPATSRSAWRVAWRIGVAYAIIASFWILLSDRALAQVVADPDRQVVLQTAKGWAFVLFTAAILVLLIRRSVARIEAAEFEHAQAQEHLRQVQKLEAVGRLAGGMAHDFNNLLTIIQSYAALLREGTADAEERTASIQQISDAATRAASLTKQLLAFSRRQALRLEPFDLNDVVRPTVDMLQRMVGDTVALVHDLAPAPLVVVADRNELAQVLVTLVANAREAVDATGTIRVRTRAEQYEAADATRLGLPQPGPYANLLVQDTGRGMDEATASRIFEPFFTTRQRSPRTGDAVAGSGLGLASVYGTVTQSGGTIQLETAPGSGSTFVLRFPLARQEAPPARTPAEPAATARADEARLEEAPTIVLAEDDEAIRTLTARVLRRAGYDVVAVADGEEALAATERLGTAPALLLTDVLMPRLGGRELASRLRVRYPTLPIVYMSGYSEDETLRSDAAAHGGTYLAKPFTPNELVAAIRGVLELAGVD